LSDDLLSIQFNSVYFILPNIKNYKFVSEGFTICTHTTSLSQNLTSDQEKLQEMEKKSFTGKKVRDLQEINRGGSLSPDGQKQ